MYGTKHQSSILTDPSLIEEKTRLDMNKKKQGFNIDQIVLSVGLIDKVWSSPEIGHIRPGSSGLKKMMSLGKKGEKNIPWGRQQVQRHKAQD